MSNIKQSYDIVIVGGGMVGASLACALAKTSYTVAMVEGQSLESLVSSGDVNSIASTDTAAEKKPIDQYCPRVSALTVASQTFLDNLGIWPRVLEKRASPYQEMKVWDGDGTASIEFNAAELYQPELGHIVEKVSEVLG